MFEVLHTTSTYLPVTGLWSPLKDINYNLMIIACPKCRYFTLKIIAFGVLQRSSDQLSQLSTEKGVKTGEGDDRRHLSVHSTVVTIQV